MKSNKAFNETKNINTIINGKNNQIKNKMIAPIIKINIDNSPNKITAILKKKPTNLIIKLVTSAEKKLSISNAFVFFVFTSNLLNGENNVLKNISIE